MKRKKPAMKERERGLWQRRELLRMALVGGAGLGSYGVLRRFGFGDASRFVDQAEQLLPRLSSLNAADILADAAAFGPSLLPVSRALAQGGPDVPAVFRVFYETSHDIRNELHLTDYGNQYDPFSTLNYGQAASQLQGKLQKAPGGHSIMNKWAHDLVRTGKINGETPLSGTVEDKETLSNDELERISVVAAVGMNGGEGIHERAAIPNVGTLEYAVAQSFDGFSPVGSVSLNAPIIDAAGGVNSPGTTVADFIASVDVPDTYMSRARDDNPVRQLDSLAGGKKVKQVRDQMLDAHHLLTEQLKKIQTYSGLAAQSFSTYGPRKLEGLASMMMFADLFEQGLATLGSTGLNSFDFHATDALRTPTDDNGNMLTETSQALAGVFHIARAAFAAQKDAIVHCTTCSNRSADWVVDDGHVSTVTFVIKGSRTSPFESLPSQVQLLPDNMGGVYAEGPGNQNPTYSGTDAQKIGLDGGGITVGQMESTIVHSVGEAIGKKPAHQTEKPFGKLG